MVGFARDMGGVARCFAAYVGLGGEGGFSSATAEGGFPQYIKSNQKKSPFLAPLPLPLPLPFPPPAPSPSL